jgi:predicted nuclease of restriction endonuclease-like (RecB) superfamily
LKSKIRSVQIKAAMAVNSALIEFYWELGGMISERQTAYGTGFIPQLSKDLQEEFKEMKGLSVRNLAFCRQFYQFYSFLNLQQPVANSAKLTNTKGAISDLDCGYQFILQIPWGHNILIFTKSKNLLEAHFYIQKTIENNWSRDNLALQIKTDLYKRNGKAVSNFKNTLPEPLSELAQQTLKDPYIFDFMAFAADFRERDI